MIFVHITAWFSCVYLIVGEKVLQTTKYSSLFIVHCMRATTNGMQHQAITSPVAFMRFNQFSRYTTAEWTLVSVMPVLWDIAAGMLWHMAFRESVASMGYHIKNDSGSPAQFTSIYVLNSRTERRTRSRGPHIHSSYKLPTSYYLVKSNYDITIAHIAAEQHASSCIFAQVCRSRPRPDPTESKRS